MGVKSIWVRMMACICLLSVSSCATISIRYLDASKLPGTIEKVDLTSKKINGGTQESGAIVMLVYGNVTISGAEYRWSLFQDGIGGNFLGIETTPKDAPHPEAKPGTSIELYKVPVKVKVTDPNVSLGQYGDFVLVTVHNAANTDGSHLLDVSLPIKSSTVTTKLSYDMANDYEVGNSQAAKNNRDQKIAVKAMADTFEINWEGGDNGLDGDIYVAYFNPAGTPYSILNTELKVVSYVSSGGKPTVFIAKLSSLIHVHSNGVNGQDAGAGNNFPGGNGGNGGNIRIFYPKGQASLGKLQVENRGGLGGHGGTSIDPVSEQWVFGQRGSNGLSGSTQYIETPIDAMKAQNVFGDFNVSDQPVRTNG